MIIKYALWLGLIIAILTAVISWKVFKYQECKQVGHSTLYCWLSLGEK